MPLHSGTLYVEWTPVSVSNARYGYHMNRSRVASLLLAGLATIWLLVGANLGLTGAVVNATWLILGLSGALGAIWMAWSPRAQSIHEQDRSIDQTFTEL